MKKHLFVINPVSGGVNKDQLIKEIEDNYSSSDTQYSIYQTTGTNDLQKVKNLIVEEEPERIIIAGGDGTVNQFLPIFLNSGIKLGILPAGSANGLATELGIIPENALETALQNHVNELNVIHLDDTRMTHLADFGLNAMLVKRYEEENRRGMIGYAISALKEMPSIEDPFTVSVRTAEWEKKFTTTFMVIANARMYGTGFKVNPEGKTDDGKVELCFLKEFSPQLILDILSERQESDVNNLFEVISVDSAEITLDKATDFQSDGEYIGKLDRLSVSVNKHLVSVLTPPILPR